MGCNASKNDETKYTKPAVRVSEALPGAPDRNTLGEIRQNRAPTGCGKDLLAGFEPTIYEDDEETGGTKRNSAPTGKRVSILAPGEDFEGEAVEEDKDTLTEIRNRRHPTGASKNLLAGMEDPEDDDEKEGGQSVQIASDEEDGNSLSAIRQKRRPTGVGKDVLKLLPTYDSDEEKEEDDVLPDFDEEAGAEVDAAQEEA
jgi:hypothetical protein